MNKSFAIFGQNPFYQGCSQK